MEAKDWVTAGLSLLAMVGSNKFQVEIDPFCNKVLARHFPDTARHQDIKTFDATPYRGMIDVLSGGWPCTPFSSLGDKKGSLDPNYLWPHMHRIIAECRPRWVVRACVVPAEAVGAKHQRRRLWIVAHAGSRGFEALEPPAVASELPAAGCGRVDPVSVWSTPMPPLTAGCGVAHGIPRDLERTRRSRLHGLGNAVVPAVAYAIFRAIEMFEGGR